MKFNRANNDYKKTQAETRYIRETEYGKFIELKKQKHLGLSDYASIWKVTLLLLMSKQVLDKEGVISQLLQYNLFSMVNEAVEEYYQSAFAPEIIQALSFVEESQLAAELISKYANLRGVEKTTRSFAESKFQANLFYLQRQFESALAQVRLEGNHILFVDGIDIRPAGVPYSEYLECIKGLANAVWELNNDFFPSIKGGKGRMRVVLLIRPDIFQSLGLQNQNSKIRENSVYLNWQTEYTNHRSSPIFGVIDHLILSQQNEALEPGQAWDHYFPWDSPNVHVEYPHPTSFIGFLRWSYHRPRDILVMLRLLQDNVSADAARVSFDSKDFEDPSFARAYSNYLLGEVKDHLLFYFSDRQYELFLKFFEFLSGANKFSYASYLLAFEKFENYLDSVRDERPSFTATANDFLQFLFELNVLCFIERTEDNKPFIHWCFRDRNYANISPKVKVGVEYQIFYGLAKALNLGKVFEQQKY